MLVVLSLYGSQFFDDRSVLSPGVRGRRRPRDGPRRRRCLQRVERAGALIAEELRGELPEMSFERTDPVVVHLHHVGRPSQEGGD